jgi:hypothetical protein
MAPGNSFAVKISPQRRRERREENYYYFNKMNDTFSFFGVSAGIGEISEK